MPPIVPPGEKSAKSLPHFGFIALLLGISGAISLAYEVLWQRQFALLFGSAAPATAATLGAYFSGLGLGAWVIGRAAHRWRNPLRVYAGLELAIGLGALAVSPVLSGFERIYPWCFQLLAKDPGWFLALRTLAALLALLVPTFCMGGTIPLLGPLVDAGRKHLGSTAGWLYEVNTVGAAAGALAVPFVLLPRFGISKIVWGCAFANLILAVCAWIADTRSPSVAITREKVPPRKAQSHSGSKARQAKIEALSFLSGATIFALQVLWNRAFAQIHENSLYSFALIVAIAIAALALGAQLARIALARGWAADRVLASAWSVVGLLLIGSPGLFLALSDHLNYLSLGQNWNESALHLAGLALAILVAPLGLLGMAFPLLLEQAGQRSSCDDARAIGRLLLSNVAGAVVGSLVFGLLLPNWLGLWNSIIWVGGLLLAIGLGQTLSFSKTARFPGLRYGLALAWLLSAPLLAHLDLARVSVSEMDAEQLVNVREGPYGITSVVDRPGSRRLKLNNHYGLGGTASTGDERMQAHIPLLLHPAPRRVAFLGLGTGITAGGALFHPIEQVTVMELVPDVVRAAQNYFADANLSVIDNPHTRVIADDARHSLRSSSDHYDVIVGDLVVPWRQGEGSLFTLEQFLAARAALAPGGIFCQWLPLFQLSEQEVKILMRTFLQVFPHAQIWRGDFSPTEPAIALIGSNAALALDSALVRKRLSEMKIDRSNLQLESAEDFWMNYVGDVERSDFLADQSQLNLDDRPLIEMLGPLHHAGNSDRTLFIGRPLQAWLNHLSAHSKLTRPLLSNKEEFAIDAGAVLAEMTLCLSEGDRSGAAAAQERLRRLLPPEAFQRLF